MAARCDHDDEDYLLRFGRHLKVLRVRSGLSQEALGELAGMHRIFIGKLERGKSGLNVQRLPDLARGLRVGPPELLPP